MLMFFSLLLGLLTIFCTLLPLLKYEVWWIRVFDFPRIQIFIFSLLAIALTIPFLSHQSHIILLVILVGCIIYQIVRIFPYTPLSKVQVLNSTIPNDKNTQIGIMVANVLMTNRNFEQCLKLIDDINPDLFLALETDAWWEKKLSVLKQEYPYTVLVPLENTYGMLLYSKFKLYETSVQYIIQEDVPSIHTLVALPSGDTFAFHGVHPKPPAPQESKTSKPRDAELILVGKAAKDANIPVIIAGDLNDVAWSHTTHLFQRIASLLDPRIGRGMYSTFHADYLFLRWPLDHVFHSRDFRLISMARLPHIGSDHFPIYVKLNFEPEKKHEQEKPQATAEDLEDAKEKLDLSGEEL